MSDTTAVVALPVAANAESASARERSRRTCGSRLAAWSVALRRARPTTCPCCCCDPTHPGLLLLLAAEAEDRRKGTSSTFQKNMRFRVYLFCKEQPQQQQHRAAKNTHSVRVPLKRTGALHV